MQNELDTQRQDPAGRNRPMPHRPLRVAAALALLAVLVLVAYASLQPLGDIPGAGASQDAGSTQTVRAGGGAGIGDPAPDFPSGDGRVALLTGLDDRPIRLADFAGRPLWIVFWATWCTPCQQEALDIRAAFRAHQSDGLAVLAIDVQEPASTVRAYVIARGLDYTIGLDPTAAVTALYRAPGLPSHVFVDRSGIIRDRYAGQLMAALMETHLATIIGR